ncbi:hypothetical protein [Streptomyces hydrogenans]|uniref:hypothetical protein n=1 Tax=Streptomyces hydrogenans TaxID=1873719 RepID=UPI00381F0103
MPSTEQQGRENSSPLLLHSIDKDIMPTITPDPERAAQLAIHLFATEDRSHTGTQQLAFINSGGRSKLQVFLGFDLKGRVTKPLAPTLHRRIGEDLITVAHDYARARFGRRADWPVRFIVQRPVVPAAPGRPQPMPCPDCKKIATLAFTGTGRYECRGCAYEILDPATAYPDIGLTEGRALVAIPYERGGVLHLAVPRNTEAGT